MNQREITHQWAHQTKSHGKASALSFDGPCIYSYSTVIGRILAPGVYLLNRASFSVTTAKQQGYVWQAIPSADTVLFYADGRRGTSLQPGGGEVISWNIEQAHECAMKAAREKKFWLLLRASRRMASPRRARRPLLRNSASP